jgi:hypothetical protein
MAAWRRRPRPAWESPRRRTCLANPWSTFRSTDFEPCRMGVANRSGSFGANAAQAAVCQFAPKRSSLRRIETPVNAETQPLPDIEFPTPPLRPAELADAAAPGLTWPWQGYLARQKVTALTARAWLGRATTWQRQAATSKYGTWPTVRSAPRSRGKTKRLVRGVLAGRPHL